MERKQEVVVVTGASAGIGRATVREFAKRKARIGLLARGRHGLEGAKAEVESLGGQAVVLRADVADPSAVESAAEMVEREFGPIDVWINNAMASVFSPVKDMDADEYRRVTEVTYLGTVYGTQSALKRMLPRDQGHIILVGSALAYRGIPLQSAYCAAKHAIQGFADSLRCELLHFKSKVRLTMVQLAGFNTPQFEWVKSRMPGKPKPIGAIYQPELAAEAIYWAAHHNRRELFVGTPAAKAIFGNNIAPQYADWALARSGFAGQQREEPDDPTRPNNLWEPVEGDHGSHGPFDSEAKDHSNQYWLTTNRGALALAGMAVTAVAGAAYLKLRCPGGTKRN